MAAIGKGILTSNEGNSEGFHNEDFSLFNQLDNLDYLQMDDVVAQMSGWKPPELKEDALTTALDADVPLPEALRGLDAHNYDDLRRSTEAVHDAEEEEELSEDGSSEFDKFDESAEGEESESYEQISEGKETSEPRSSPTNRKRSSISGRKTKVATSHSEKDHSSSAGAGGTAMVKRKNRRRSNSSNNNKRPHVKAQGIAVGGESLTDDDEGEQEGVANKLQKKQRNREHARNTRARKKQALENLQHQLQDLTDAKDEHQKYQQSSLVKSAENQTFKKQLLQTFLYYRARGEVDRKKWTVILTEDFSAKFPITHYRFYPHEEAAGQCRHIRGVDGMVRDTASFKVFIDSLSGSSLTRVVVQFFSEAENIITNADTLMCRWSMKTENASRMGEKIELDLHGMLRAEYRSQEGMTKIHHLSVIFDVMGLVQQLRRIPNEMSMKQPSALQLSPSTLESADEPSLEPRITFAIQAPFLIRSVNEAWVQAAGIKPEDCQHKCVRLERNPRFQPAAGGVSRSGGGATTTNNIAPSSGSSSSSLRDAFVQTVQYSLDCLRRQLPHSFIVLYATSQGRFLCCRLRLLPLQDPTTTAGGNHNVTHCMGGLEILLNDQDPSFPADYPVLLRIT